MAEQKTQYRRPYEVGLIGLGPMGLAIARTWLKAGLRTIVFNRNREKALTLLKGGAACAVSAGDAVRQSELTIICVSDYVSSRAMLDACGSFAGSLIIQVGTSSSAEAETFAAFVSDRGGGYLDGAILSYPEQIGTDDAEIFLSGPLERFRVAESALRLLAPRARHIGLDIGAASVVDCALLSSFTTMALSCLHGLRLAETAGFSPADFVAFVRNRQLGNLALEIENMVEHSPDLDVAHVPVRVWRSAAARVLGETRDRGVSDTLPVTVLHLLSKAIQDGKEDADLTSVISAKKS